MRRKFAGLLAIIMLLSAVGCSEKQPVVESPPPVQETTADFQPPVSTPDAAPTLEQISEAPPSAEPIATPESEPEQNVKIEQTMQSEPEPLPEILPEPEASVHPTDPSDTTLPILMYHHVVPDGTACNDMTVTVSKLDQDLQWIKEQGYEPILPRDLISGSPLPEKPILITFDDGYLSNYELAYPLFQKHQAKAVVSIIVCTQGSESETWLSWDMCREMSDSGLIEIGSHTYCLHNFDERGGNFIHGGTNGIQRYPEESDTNFQARVLDDLQKSHDLIEKELGCEVTFFAYPFGLPEPDAELLIDALFPVTVVTQSGHADLSSGVKNMPRWTVTMNTDLASVLNS